MIQLEEEQKTRKKNESSMSNVPTNSTLNEESKKNELNELKLNSINENKELL